MAILDYGKIEKEILTDAIKRDNIIGKKPFPWHYQVIDENIMVTDSRVCFIIPLSKFHLDIVKTFQDTELKGFEKFVKNEPDSTVQETGVLYPIDDGKKILIEFTFPNGNYMYIDQQYLKYFKFDKYTACFAQAPNQPLYIREDDELVGIIMPVKREGAKK